MVSADLQPRSPDRHSLQRFVLAQDDGATYERAVAELRGGRKQSHWMWFVFPQIAGLGQSAMSRTYAISSLQEARAYLEHPLLGPRLLQCTQIVAELRGASAQDVFGAIDAVKLRSSMTLFAAVAPPDSPFKRVLVVYFDGATDAATESLLSSRERGDAS
jgi:uncharacterized protein (DUF1810 family)